MQLIDPKQSLETQEFQKQDLRKYFVEKGQPGFSPERNKWAVDEVIRKTDQMKAIRTKLYREKIRERADAVATFIRSKWVNSPNSVDKYFGKKWLAHLAGMKIRDRLMTYSGKIGNKIHTNRLIYLPN